MVTHIPVALQAGGILATLAGLFMLLPLGWAVLAAGALVAVVGVALEVGNATPGRRSRANRQAAE